MDSHTTKPIIAVLREVRRSALILGPQTATAAMSVTPTHAVQAVVVQTPRKATARSVVATHVSVTRSMQQTNAKMVSVKTVEPPIATAPIIPAEMVHARACLVERMWVA